jgi:hypothetical protein
LTVTVSPEPPERDVVDIDEQIRLAEMLRQPVEDAPGHGGVGPPIGDDNLRILSFRHHVFPGPQMTTKDRSVLLKERDRLLRGYLTGTTASFSRR